MYDTESVSHDLVASLMSSRACHELTSMQKTHRALRVAGGSARYARSQGRSERNDRFSTWSNILGANRRPANAKSSMLQENNPNAAQSMNIIRTYYTYIYFFRYVLYRHLPGTWFAAFCKGDCAVVCCSICYARATAAVDTQHTLTNK